KLDLVFGSVRLGNAWGGCIPEVKDTVATLNIKKARHPMIERDRAVCFDLDFSADIDIILITGPNTGGKTVTLKSVGLAVLMAQSGLMVCANKAEMGLFSQIWVDIGDEQSLHQSLSTFSAHIRHIANALDGLKPGALVLIDEIGAGTD